MLRLAIATLVSFLLTALPTAQAPARPQRIISLIPAVTEILFAIGAGPQVVAVSSFDEYPPEVKNLQRVERSSIRISSASSRCAPTSSWCTEARST
jgi:ABC-type hemin transport system substrate-binding protein